MMKAAFTYALRYWVDVTCESPLRTGGAERDAQQVLRRWDGTPFLQGTSLAGALRDWREDNVLFGSQEQEGALTVSDLEFAPEAAQGTRPRLRVDGKTGTGAEGGKFDVSALLSGTTGSFELVWQGNIPTEEATPVIEPYLAALHNGDILLGAQKSNGFGRVHLSVKRRRYDMSRPEDFKAWLEDAPGDETVDLSQATSEQVVFRVTASLHQLLVKTAGAEGVGEKGVDALPMIENGSLLLPGSSIKGALRAQMEKIAPFCLGDAAAGLVEDFLGRPSTQDRDGKKDNGIAGKACFSDAVFGSVENLKKIPKVTRIHINRLTGGVLRGALFTEKPVTDEVKWTITAPVKKAAGCALLLFALRDLGLGLFSLGSGGSIGHGRADWVKVEITVPGKETVTLVSEPESVTLQDPENVVSGWLDACKEVQL